MTDGMYHYHDGDSLYKVKRRKYRGSRTRYYWTIERKKITKVVDGDHGISLLIGGHYVGAEEISSNTRIVELPGDRMITDALFLGTDRALRKANHWVDIANMEAQRNYLDRSVQKEAQHG